VEGRGVGTERADKLYAKVLNEYGDDSVAQLGAAHLACEGVSNVLTKVLDGRLMAYGANRRGTCRIPTAPNGPLGIPRPVEHRRIRRAR